MSAINAEMTETEREKMNAWFKEFNVSSRYEEKPNTIDTHAFDSERFKKTVRNMSLQEVLA